MGITTRCMLGGLVFIVHAYEFVTLYGLVCGSACLCIHQRCTAHLVTSCIMSIRDVPITKHLL